MKIVGIGLNKTGTTTLGYCMRFWGLRHISCSKDAFTLWRDGNYDAIFQGMTQFDSFEDWPWPLMYREIDRAFPGSRFILTTRKDPETWFGSLCRQADTTGPTDFRRYIYGYAMPRGHESEHIRFYLDHNQAVRDYFRDRPESLLEVCWENGDGWDELSGFLGLPRPDVTFPGTGRPLEPEHLDHRRSR